MSTQAVEMLCQHPLRGNKCTNAHCAQPSSAHRCQQSHFEQQQGVNRVSTGTDRPASPPTTTRYGNACRRQVGACERTLGDGTKARQLGCSQARLLIEHQHWPRRPKFNLIAALRSAVGTSPYSWESAAALHKHDGLMLGVKSRASARARARVCVCVCACVCVCVCVCGVCVVCVCLVCV